MARTAVLTKEQIIQSAFNITNKLGFENITIRAIANDLETSTAPIYTQYPNIESIYTDLEVFVDNKLKESTKVERTVDSFLNIGVGMLAFALEYKLVFTNFYLTKDKPSFNIKKNEADFIAQMKQNPFLSIFDDERLKTILEDMWVFTYGLATMICTGIETSQDLNYYQSKLEQTGNRIITYHLISSGNFENYVHQLLEKFSKYVDMKEFFKHENTSC